MARTKSDWIFWRDEQNPTQIWKGYASLRDGDIVELQHMETLNADGVHWTPVVSGNALAERKRLETHGFYATLDKALAGGDPNAPYQPGLGVAFLMLFGSSSLHAFATMLAVDGRSEVFTTLVMAWPFVVGVAMAFGRPRIVEGRGRLHIPALLL